MNTKTPKICILLFIAAIALILGRGPALAGSATWSLTPGSADWNTAANWTPATVPNTSADTATFGLSTITNLSISANTEANSIVFNSGANVFTITANPTFTLTISGVGITNNSGVGQAFVTAVDGAGNRGLIKFTNSATAGSQIIFTNNGATVVGADGGGTEFFNTSTAGHGTFTNNGATVSGAFEGFTAFLDTSTAGNGSFTNNGGTASGASGGVTEFHNASTAGNGTFTNNAGTISGAGGSFTRFLDSSTAGNGTFTNNGATVSGAGAGVTVFSNSSTAANATINNNPGTANSASGGETQFNNSSTAANATITNNGAAISGGFGGKTFFFNMSTAGSATITNNGGAISGGGGSTFFDDTSTASSATIINNGGTVANGGGLLQFLTSSSAGSATITNNGSTVSGGQGVTVFFNSSTAESATITNNGGAVGGGRGATFFNDTSTAGSATLIANGGTGGGPGGSIQFSNTSTGGTARVEVFGNGNLDISPHNAPGVTVGSIEGDGNIFLGGNNLTVGSNNMSTTFSGVIQDGGVSGGTGGSLTKIGTGTLSLTNDNTYTGGTTINNGVLAVGSLNSLGAGGADVRINIGTLETVGESPLIFNTPGDFIIHGDTALTILRLKVGGTNSGVNTDLMNVGNDAFLSGELFVHRINNFEPAVFSQVTILHTGDSTGRVDTFQFVQSDFPGLIQPTPVYFANHVEVEFLLSPFTSVSGLTRNQSAVASALDKAFTSACLPASTFNFLGNQPIAALPHDFDLIAPEELAAIYEISFSQATVQNNNLMRRMDDIHAGSNGYCGPVVEINPPIEEGKNVVSKNVAPAFVPSPDNRWGIFITGGGDNVVVGNDDDNARGYQLRIGDLTAGVDYRVLHNLAIGLYGGYDGSEAELAGKGRLDMAGGKVGGFATWFSNGFYLDAAGGGAWNNYHTHRDALGVNDPMLGIHVGDLANGSTNGSEYNAMGAIGYDWKHDFGKPGCLNIGPLVSIQYTNVDINRFTEHGSLIPLEILGQSEDSLRLTAGGKVSLDVHSEHGVIFRPEARVAWLHEFNDSAYPIKATFAGCPDVFTVFGPTIGRDAALVGAGVTVQVTPTFAIFGHYDGIVSRNNYNSNAVNGGFSFSF